MVAYWRVPLHPWSEGEVEFSNFFSSVQDNVPSYGRGPPEISRALGSAPQPRAGRAVWVHRGWVGGVALSSRPGSHSAGRPQPQPGLRQPKEDQLAACPFPTLAPRWPFPRGQGLCRGVGRAPCSGQGHPIGTGVYSWEGHPNSLGVLSQEGYPTRAGVCRRGLSKTAMARLMVTGPRRAHFFRVPPLTTVCRAVDFRAPAAHRPTGTPGVCGRRVCSFLAVGVLNPEAQVPWRRTPLRGRRAPVSPSECITFYRKVVGDDGNLARAELAQRAAGGRLWGAEAA